MELDEHVHQRLCRQNEEGCREDSSKLGGRLIMRVCYFALDKGLDCLLLVSLLDQKGSPSFMILAKIVSGDCVLSEKTLIILPTTIGDLLGKQHYCRYSELREKEGVYLTCKEIKVRSVDRVLKDQLLVFPH